MQLFISEYGNYYHFISESAMGLYRELRDHNMLASKDCELFYKGKYASIVQLFSCRPVHVLDSVEQASKEIRTLTHIRPKNLAQWKELLPLRDYIEAMFPVREQEPGITVIRRVGRREYAEHSELVSKLGRFDMPVREAVLESVSFEEQVNLMRTTSVLIGPHGAGQTNMIFMKTGSKVVELYPKGFSDRCFRGLAFAFGHDHIEVESCKPSVIGRKPSERVQKYLDANPWPTRKEFSEWGPDQMELGRVLRDVASFSIDPEIVVQQVDEMLSRG
jgi:hypothetical protein